MYYQYFGLTEAPFSIAVNPRYLFMSARHRDALAHLLYGVGAGGGFILLTGEVGTGKTTINRCLLEQLPDDTDVAIILNPALNAIELLATVCDELGIGYDPANHTLKSLTDSLHAYLLANYERGRKTVLMIDEAQHLDFEVLEQIRLLTNLETHSEKLLQIILIGQPELAQLLSQPELRQLNQRITARYNLEPLNLDETGAYIQHRLQVAGMTPGRVVFPGAVVKGIYQRTRGIPRLINVLCDRMLLGAYGHNKSKVDQSMLRLAAREVMGEDLPANAGWRRPVLAILLLVAVVLLAWLGAGFYANETARDTTLAAQQQPTPLSKALATNSPSNEAARDTRTEAAKINTPEQPPVQLPIEVPAVVATQTPELPVITTGDWLLPPMETQALLWRLYSPDPPPSDACPDEAHLGVACVTGRAQTWDELAVYDRPLLLDMVTPQRFAAVALLLGFDGREAWVWTQQGAVRLSLGEIAPMWTGTYRFLWHPPLGFERALALGDRSPAVAEIAQLFARLDGQQQALAGQKFTAALQQRVRLFQRDHGLDDDGLVGLRTLLKLNEQLAIDATAERARSLLQDDTALVVQP